MTGELSSSLLLSRKPFSNWICAAEYNTSCGEWVKARGDSSDKFGEDWKWEIWGDGWSTVGRFIAKNGADKVSSFGTVGDPCSICIEEQRKQKGYK